MILILHISIAIISLGYAAYTFFVPSRNKVAASYALSALTIASGTYLVVSLHSSILAACTTGLMYLAAVLSATYAAQRKLSTARQKTE